MQRILVTNDDGVDAKGIKALAKSLATIPGVEVIVVAPEREQSSTSHSLTLHRPLRIIKKRKNVYAVNGTPTDSVFVGVAVILKDKRPDFIFSGINRGGNLGDDVHYSGTVSAAVEGGMMGIPSVAMSQLGREKFDYDVAAKFAQKILKLIQKNNLPPGIILNVNVPEKVKSLDYEVTCTGKRDYGNLYEEKIDPRGRPYFWIGGYQYKFHDIEGSDCNAIIAQKISVSPIQVNMTSRSFVTEMKKWK